ncbi:DUF397 domain-containing protein [Streptomyces scopuliridis]|uniref:DUF397 domain-containing protein n=1 Tax=Streptomyces scopuliridis TaxID=452529 RepID=UPI002DDAA6A0|nr:DUF397 domain-containing protein [Streptomyces scopuliridis]WSB35501.1 DUF397 domain-containing protein [Streptomyces scopuliridis]
MTSDEFDGAAWHKSTYSGSDNGCVERGQLRTGRQAVRDTKDRARGAVVFEPVPWQTFVNAVRSGALSL